MRDLASLTAADFEPFSGSDFEVRHPATGQAVLVLRLVEVTAWGPPLEHRQPFRLHFQGPASPVLPQAIHRLSHPEMGELDLFVGPVMAPGPGTTYEAVFA
jgi:hypothetical protein